MLLEIYLFLTLISYITLFLSVTTKRTTGDENQKSEARGNIPLAITAAIIFFTLSYTSLDIEYKECENQILWMNQSQTNNTQISNQISCETSTEKDSVLSTVNLGMGILSILFTIFFTLFEFQKPPQTRSIHP